MTDHSTTASQGSRVTRARDALWRFVVRRSRTGFQRARSSVLLAAASAVAAVGAYAFANVVLGHEDPIFAATAALVSLGFGRDPRTRKVLEVMLGCTLGILIGDLMMEVLGQGYWQGLIVVFISIIIARFLDTGVVFTTQMSLQAVLVVLLPIPDAGPFARSLDAVVGGLFALAITIVMPKNLQGETVKGFKTLFGQLTEIFRDCSTALREHDSRTAWMAVVSARNTQGAIDSLKTALSKAQELAVYSPTGRNTRPLLSGTADTVEKTELAIGSLRLVTRRVITVIDESTLTEDQLAGLADWFDEAADAIAILGRSLSEPALPGRHRSLAVAREALASATTSLTPKQLGVAEDLHAEALVMLMRPMMVDLIQATGTPHAEATDYLPRVQ